MLAGDFPPGGGENEQHEFFLNQENDRFYRLTTAFSPAVTFAANVSWDGGAGNTDWKDEDGETSRTHFYGIANLYYEFLKDNKMSVSGTSIRSGAEALWVGVGVGLSHSWGDDARSIYAEVDADTSLSGFGDSREIRGILGFRATW